jgi:methylmalonyl-CoA mutase cobalamin-binding subunit
MRFLALDMGYEAHTAGIVFIARVIEALGLRKSHR